MRFRVFITRDFVFAIKADFISVCQDMGDYIPADWEMIEKYRRGSDIPAVMFYISFFLFF